MLGQEVLGLHTELSWDTVNPNMYHTRGFMCALVATYFAIGGRYNTCSLYELSEWQLQPAAAADAWDGCSDNCVRLPQPALG